MKFVVQFVVRAVGVRVPLEAVHSTSSLPKLAAMWRWDDG